MEKRELSILITIVVLALVAYWIFSPRFVKVDIEGALAGKPIGYGMALEELTNATSICIVEDVNVGDPVRKNIMNCGINLASSAPKFGKSVYAYAFEGDKCYAVDGEKSVSECVADIKAKGCFILLLGSEDLYEQNSYDNMVVIPVGEEISERDCRIVG